MSNQDSTNSINNSAANAHSAVNDLEESHSVNLPTEEQREVCDKLKSAVESGSGDLLSSGSFVPSSDLVESQQEHDVKDSEDDEEDEDDKSSEYEYHHEEDVDIDEFGDCIEKELLSEEEQEEKEEEEEQELLKSLQAVGTKVEGNEGKRRQYTSSLPY